MRPHERAGAVDLDDFSAFDTIIDVRSPAEFALDHLPGSVNHPVLDDAQRAEVGTLYKQVDPFAARRLGAAMVSANIANHLNSAFADRPKTWRPLVVCWRGGMRSGSMTTVLRAVGWDALQLPGGYKRWRAHVVQKLNELPARFRFCVVCGPTGSGKSRLLLALQAAGAQVLDLEVLAAHRGSVLGALPDQPQPSQRLFENHLHAALGKLDPARPVFVEAESRRIGLLHVPEALMVAMRASACARIVANEMARVELLLADYAHFLQSPEQLVDMLLRLRELHGNEQIAAWTDLVRQGRFAQLVEALLRKHYDALYRRSSNGNYTHLGHALVLDGGALADDDFGRMAQALIDNPPSLPAADKVNDNTATPVPAPIDQAVLSAGA